VKRRSAFAISLALLHGLSADPAPPTCDEILARVEAENGRRHDKLKEYRGSRHYTLLNARFGKEAAVSVAMKYRELEGERYTVLTQSGSARLIGIINTVLASEARASVPLEISRHQISAANYRVRLLGMETIEGRICYVLALAPKNNSRYLIVGKAWVDAENFGTVRIDGQFAASISVLIGAPHLREEFVEVNGFRLPGHVRSTTSSLLLGPTELDIVYSNYQTEPDPVFRSSH
jgi:hypothetical protein